MAATKQRDTGLNRLSTLQADLGDFAIATTRGWAIEVELTYGRLYARHDGQDGADVVMTGTGGGFISRRSMNAQQLARLLGQATGDDPRVRRGPVSVFPDRYKGGGT